MRGVIIPEEQLRQYKADKISDEEIAARHDISARTVGVMRSRYNISALENTGRKSRLVITEEQFRQYKADKISDEEIAALYGVHRRTIGRLREKHSIDAMTRSEAAKAYTERTQPAHCQNPNCGRKAKNYKLGLCNACYDWQRTHNGEQRTPQREWTRNKGQWCVRCKERRAYCKKKCAACYFYEKINGKPRERYRWQDACTVCGKPREKSAYAKGRCKPCYGHWARNGVDKTPEQVAAIVPFGWCDCGEKAAVRDVPLRVMTIDKKVEYEEKYNLCTDCYKAEFGKLPPPPDTKEKPLHGKPETAYAPAEIAPRPGLHGG